MCASEVRVGHSLKKAWSPSPEAFQRFLAWLDEGVDSRGERYLEMRRRLVSYFNRKRCLAPDDLADETLNRVTRRLEEAGEITDAVPARYCYIVARYVFLEHLRSADAVWSVAIVPETGARDVVVGDSDAGEDQQLSCLDGCLDQLSNEDRSLILAYYSADAGQRIADRRALARQLGLTANALTIRASRIRARLEACVSACVDQS